MKGATCNISYRPSGRRYFNPRTHEGCDTAGCMRSTTTRSFQSTHPWRVRHFGGDVLAAICFNFNPRTHEGCDLNRFMRISRTKPFQSTHPWRVRHYRKWPVLQGSGFQSTHPWRVRLLRDSSTFIEKKFQSTHPWRVRQPAICHYRCWIAEFQSTHPWRVRLFYDWDNDDAYVISIHAPMKGATVAAGNNFIGGNISIHAPMKGATWNDRPGNYRSHHFNPRTHEGCDSFPFLYL